MLNSQITLSARNIPTFVATTIRTKEPRQVMSEDVLAAHWPADAAAYRKRVEKHHPNTGRKLGSAKPLETFNSQVLAVLSKTKWTSVTQVRDSVGLGYNRTRNALDRLVSKREVDRRVIQNANGQKNRTYYRINAKAANRKERDAAILDYMAEPRGVVDLAKFSGLSPQRISYMLGEWFECGVVEREWTPGSTGRGTHLWKRKEGGA